MILKEFKGKEWIIKFVKEVDVIVVKGDKNVCVRINGKVLKC